MSDAVWSVSQLNEYIRSRLDGDTVLTSVAIRGEISNYKLYPSGHHYFSLKDQESSLKCVMFRGNAFKLRFRPENNMQVIALGKISVYPRDGVYQLYCTGMIVDGVGDLHAALEQLKKKLSAEGLFDPEHKKPLPRYPQVVGVVTSSAGAAIHDIIRVLKKRYPICRVRLFPVRVQGAEAAAEIATAIEYANEHKLADLLIVGRGGGSMEDLWAFNEEPVARAIYHSQIPVISAVGHEPDITISDYVADVRAATPSNGAEIAVPDQNAIRQRLDSILFSMGKSLQNQLKTARIRLRSLAEAPSLQSPQNYFVQKREALTNLHSRLISAQNEQIGRKKQKFIGFAAKLDAMSPLKVLTRGYSMAQDGSGNLLWTSSQVHEGDLIHIRLSEGELDATVTKVGEHK